MEQQAEDMAVAAETGAPTHPLDPCTGDELVQAVAILRDSGSLGEKSFFTAGYAAEPPKDVVVGFEPGASWDRLVRLVGHDRNRGESFDARVSLTEERVAAFTWVEDGQANVAADDYFAILKTLWRNEEWIAAVKKRGIEDLSLVHIEPWVAGARHPDLPANARQMRALAFLHADRADNYYARPLEGLSAHVDCDSGQVVVEDHGVLPVPTDPAEYAADRVERLREDLRPIEITQPEGPSFEVEGNVVRWQKWQLRVSMQPTEGLVLHDIRYDDDGRDRPILYRAALSDMVVPYGDTSPMHGWKHAFDGGEAALGHSANSLVNGCDCLGEIHYFDNFVLQGNGEPRHVPNAICLHEEDFGLLWKHTNVFTQHPKPEVRRSRRLVISSIVTLGNYEYGFYWYFYLDGTIQVEIKLTGMVGVSVVENNADSDVAPIIAESIASPIHQHIFCFRLDFNLDGPNNSVYELEVEPLPPGADNPYGRSPARGQPGARPPLARRERPRQEPPRQVRGLQAAAAGLVDDVRPGGLPARAARRLRPAQPLGDALRAGRTRRRRRRVHEPALGRQRARGLRRREPLDRRHRRGRLAHAGGDARAAAGGLAGDARGVRRIHADADGLLRPQPGAGRAADEGLPYVGRGALHTAHGGPRSGLVSATGNGNLMLCNHHNDDTLTWQGIARAPVWRTCLKRAWSELRASTSRGTSSRMTAPTSRRCAGACRATWFVRPSASSAIERRSRTSSAPRREI